MKIKYDVGLAMYPTKYKECVVSEKKICLQFYDAEVKVRAPHEKREILKQYGDTLPLKTTADEVSVIAIGMVFPVLQEAQKGLIEAYKRHMQEYPGELKEFLEDIKKDIESLL